MNITGGQLRLLTKVLPRLKFATVVGLSQFLGFDLNGLLSIRTAGRTAAVEDEEAREQEDVALEDIMEGKREEEETPAKDYIEDHSDPTIAAFNSYVENDLVRKKYFPDTKLKLQKALANNPNANEIMQKLSSPEFTKSSKKHTDIKKDVRSYAKEVGLTGTEIDLADSYVSLQRILNGKFRTDFKSIIMNHAKKIVSAKVLESLEDAVGWIITAIIQGRKILNKSFLQGESDPEKSYSLEEQIDLKYFGEGKYVGAQSIIETLTHLSRTTAGNTIKLLKGEEHSSIHESVGDEEDSTMGDLIRDKRTESPDEAEMRREVKKILEEVVKENAKSKEEADTILWAMDYAEKAPIERKGTGEGVGLESTSYYTSDPKAWEEIGIMSQNDYNNRIRGPMQRLRPLIDARLRSEMGIRISSILSQQLLIRAAGGGKLKLASKISNVSPWRNFGNVKVYEAGKPQFAHEFYWEIDGNKVKIADVQDVDEEHIDEAYQSALQAVQQEAFRSNLEEKEKNSVEGNMG